MDFFCLLHSTLGKPLLDLAWLYFSEAASCTGSYTYLNGEFCYAFVKETKTWADAQTVCKAIGGYLVEIKTEAQNRYVESIMFEHPAQQDIWLGATDLVSEGDWFWATSDTNVSAGFTY